MSSHLHFNIFPQHRHVVSMHLLCFIAIVLMSFPSLVPWLHEFKCCTRMAAGSHYFTVEIGKCSRKLYNFFSRGSLFFLSNQLQSSTVQMQRQSCSLEFYSFYCPFASLTFSHIPLHSLTPCVLVFLSTCVRCND